MNKEKKTGGYRFNDWSSIPGKEIW